MRSTREVVLVICAVAGVRSASGSLCVPTGCGGKVYISDVQGIILYHKAHEELILRVDYDVRGATGPITKLAWIIPTPRKPEFTGTASADVFGELSEFTAAKYAGEATVPAVRGGELPEQLVLAEPNVHPLKGSGKGGIAAVNEWLQQRGLQAIPPETTRYYAEFRWSFTAVLFEMPQGVPARGRLRPVRLSFTADRVHFPLLLCAQQGVFDLTLYVVSKGRINRRELGTFGLTLTELETPEMKQSQRLTRVRDLPEHTRRLFSTIALDVPVLRKLERGRIFLYRTYAHGLNDEDRAISKWETDLQLAAPLGSPYSRYKDLAVAVAAVLAVFVVARTRQRAAKAKADAARTLRR